MRTCQDYKSAQIFDKYEGLGKHIYETMFKIDFIAANKISKKYFANLSFSFILWRRIEELLSGEININDLDREQIKAISFTILPRGRTLLHMFYTRHDLIEAVFKNSCKNCREDEEIDYAVPYMLDYNSEPKCPMGMMIDDGIADTTICTESINVTLKYLSK